MAPVYDKLASKYDGFFQPLERRFMGRWREETLSYLPESGRVLEIGAGTGLNFRFYPECEFAVACEISSRMLGVAKDKTNIIQLVRADGESLPFADNSFDAAFATLVICSIREPENAFAELRRVVKASGKIVLLEHVRPGGLLGILFDVLNIFTVRLFEDHFNRRTARLAANSGLKVLKVKRKAFGIVNLIVCEVLK